MAAELANVGVCIVSGLALGIDAAAHTGARWTQRGEPIAILGSALDQPYPAENRPLMRRILESGGSVVSEYPPGTMPTKYSFLQRNRIIAGMSLGTLVTEGPKRSGALNTAMRTIENGAKCSPCPEAWTAQALNCRICSSATAQGWSPVQTTSLPRWSSSRRARPGFRKPLPFSRK